MSHAPPLADPVADPVAAVKALEALDPATIAERLEANERERKALLMLLRAARTARRKVGREVPRRG
jgi:hypothetical protein